jgi:hypothetical protein
MARHGDTLYLKPNAKRESWFALTHDRVNSLFSIRLLPGDAAAEAAQKGITAAPLGTCAGYLEDLGELLGQRHETLCLTEAEHLLIREFCRNRHIRVSATEAKRPAIERFERCDDVARAADVKAIGYLYGTLPEWLPEPVHAGIERAVATLRNAEQSPERMATVVAQARQDKLEIPGEARDVTAFVQAAYYLAHVQRALEFDKARAVKVLAGNQAAKVYERSEAGNAVQSAGRAAQLPQGHPLRTARSVDERYQIIRKHADGLRAESPNLKESEIRGKVAVWAGLSKKQIGRILASG